MKYKLLLAMPILLYFQFNSSATPSAPTPKEPIDRTVPFPISFKWDPSTVPSGSSVLYKVQLSKGSTENDFSPPIPNDPTHSNPNWVDEVRTTLGDHQTSISYNNSSSKLANNTDYYWRVVAQTDESTNNVAASAIKKFRTILQTPTNLNTSSYDAVSGTINWSAVSGATTYNIMYGKTNPPNDVFKNTPSTSLTITGLTPHTTYYWMVQASNDYGNSQYSDVMNLSTYYRTIITNCPNKQQELSLGCWCACSQMTLLKYEVKVNGQGITQNDIGSWAVEGNDEAVSFTQPYMDNQNHHCVEQIIEHFCPPLKYNYSPTKTGAIGYLNPDEIVKSINQDHPILVHWARADGTKIGHVVLIVGYESSDGINCTNVFFNNPANPDNATVSKSTYNDFVSNVKWWWSETINPTVSPSYVKTGVNDYVIVSRPARGLSTRDSETYSASLVDSDHSGTIAQKWDWKLVLLHDAGEYYASSQTIDTITSGNQIRCNWSTKIGTLPQGYNWRRNSNSQIMGQVIVGCQDSDPPYYYHTASVNVTYSDSSNTINTGDQK